MISRFGLEQALDAFDITAIRYLVAGLILAPVLARRGLAGLPPRAIFILFCGAGAPYLMVATVGLTFAPSNHFGVITPSSMLLATAIGSALWLGDRFDPARVFGLVVIVVGIVMIGWEGLNAGGEWTLLGDCMFVAAGCFWAAYTLATRAWGVHPFDSIAIVAVFSLLFYLPVYFWFRGPSLLRAPADEVLIQAVFQGVLSGVVALWFYTRAVRILGPARGSVFAALVPGFALLLAIPILSEWPTFWQIAGVGFVTAGMIFGLGLAGSRRRTPGRPSPG